MYEAVDCLVFLEVIHWGSECWDGVSGSSVGWSDVVYSLGSSVLRDGEVVNVGALRGLPRLARPKQG